MKTNNLILIVAVFLINGLTYGQTPINGVEISENAPNTLAAKPTDGNNTLGTSINYKGCGINLAYSNYLKTYTGHANEGAPMIQPCTGSSGSQSCGMVDGANLPGTLSISGIPVNAIILQAFLHIPVQESAAGALPSFTLQNPNAITGTVSPTLVGTTQNYISSSFINESVYRTDVTSLFSGNGNYIISGLPQDYTTGNPPVATGPTRVYGAMLFVVYRDPNASYIGNVVIADGTLVFGMSGSPSSIPNVALTHNLTGLNPCSNSINGKAFMAINNLQNINTCKLGINSPFGIWNDSINYGNQTFTDFKQATTSINSGQTNVNFSASRPTYQLPNGSWTAELLNISLVGVYFQTICPSTLTSSITTNIGCSNASATASVTGGTAPYQISWNTTPIQTGVTATNLTNGTYIATIKDTTNCSEIHDTIVISGLVGIPTTVNSSTICAGNSTTLTATGANNYTWSPATGLSGTTGSSVIAFPSVTTTYTIVGETNGCTDTTTAIVTVNNSSSAIISYAGPYCQNISNPSPIFGTGASAGTFSASPSGLVFVSSTTGQINLSGSTAGTYTVTNTISASGSCPATSDTALVTINPVQSAAFSYPSTTFCQSASTVSATITGSSGGTFTATPSSLIINSSTGVIDLSSPSNTYTVTYTTPNPCGSNSTQTITISNSISATISYAGPYCQNNTNPLPILGSGASAGVYTSSPLGLVFINTSTGQINLSGSTAGTYTVTNTISASGSCPATSDTALVTINPVQSAAFTYSAYTYCQSTSTTSPTITGTAGGTFSAIPSGLIINANTGVINVSSSANTYTVTYSTAGPCPSSATQTITINPIPTVTVNSESVCSGQSVTITATPSPVGGNYSWSPTSQTTQSITASPTTTTNYTVTYSIGSCTTSATSTVTVANNITLAVNSTTICEGQFAILTATPSVTGGTYSWSPGSQTTPNISVSPSTTTNYSVTYSLSGCSANAIGSVTVSPLPIASVIIADTNVLPGENTNLIASGGGTYLWSNGETASSIFIAPTQTAVYCVTVKNSSGCSDSACVEVKVTCPSTLYIPNCFTPNGDLVNELFTVPSTCIKEFHIMIYNRWGQLIFESTDIKNSWDGKYQGNVVPDGVYVYVIEAKGFDDTIYRKPGHVTVLK